MALRRTRYSGRSSLGANLAASACQPQSQPIPDIRDVETQRRRARWSYGCTAWTSAGLTCSR